MPRSFFSALIPLFLAAACSANPGIDPAQWNDRSILPAERAVLERSVGHAPAAFDESMKWFSGTPTTWPQLRGRVVILQSFSSSATGRTALTKLTNFMSRADPAKVTAIAVHTPEKADDAFAFVGGATLGFPIVLDSVGRFCDDMGLWKTPTIILVDRAGVVRAAGVSTSKLQAAVTALLDEPFDETAAPPTAVTPRAAAAADSQKASKKPAYPSVSPRGGAVNLIGKQGPPLAVESWVNDQPNTQGKVIIVDFWATWCAPCRDSIPHMNELAAKFKDSVVAVGLSDEDPKVIQKFMKKTKMNYPVATDPSNRMAKVTKHKGIPFVIVISPDGVVRWQGHPMSLDESIVKQIVEASAPDPDQATDPNAFRWVPDAAPR